MNLFVRVGPHHLRPVGDGRVSIPLSLRCDCLVDVVAAVQSWSTSTPVHAVVAVVPAGEQHAPDRMVRWLEIARRLVPRSRVIVHRSGFTPLGVEVALERLQRAAGSELASRLAVEHLARLEDDMTTGVIRFGRRLGRPAGPLVELAGSRPRRAPLGELRSLVPAPPAVLHFTRHRGVPASALDEAFPLAWLDVSVQERPGDLGGDACWDTPAIEFAFDVAIDGSVDAIARSFAVQRSRATP